MEVLEIELGQIVFFENELGEEVEAEVIGGNESLRMLEVLPTKGLIKIPKWISIDELVLEEEQIIF